MTFKKEYQLPIDPANKLAVCINYYIPYELTLLEYFEWPYLDENGFEHIFSTPKTWGSDIEYNQMIVNFELMKSNFLDKGIPIIIGEISVLTENEKEIYSIREFLYSIFSMAADYKGLMACLWDSSNKKFGDYNFFNRENYTWYDGKIKDIFKKISKGKYIKPKDYFITTNNISSYSLDIEGSISIIIGTRKVVNIIFNINFLFKFIEKYI